MTRKTVDPKLCSGYDQNFLCHILFEIFMENLVFDPNHTPDHPHMGPEVTK